MPCGPGTGARFRLAKGRRGQSLRRTSLVAAAIGAYTAHTGTVTDTHALGRFLKSALKISLAFGTLLLVILVVAVGIQMSSLPSFDDMMRSPNGQSIRVLSADAAVVESVGPS